LLYVSVDFIPGRTAYFMPPFDFFPESKELWPKAVVLP
jgi:hypothetical protein